MIKIIEYFNSGLSCYIVTGMEKNERNERLITNCLVTMFDYKMIAPKTLNNWKNNSLVIRYARNYQELKILEEAISLDRQLPDDHDEKSLIL